MDTKEKREKIKRQLDVVQRWRRSGQGMVVWAVAQGVDAKLLMGWVAYEKRWRQRLAEVQIQPHVTTAPANVTDGATAKAAGAAVCPAKPTKLTKGFVAVRRDPVVPEQACSGEPAHTTPVWAMTQTNPNPASVRIELAVGGLGAAGLVLHWPLSQTQGLAVWLKAMITAGDLSVHSNALADARC